MTLVRAHWGQHNPDVCFGCKLQTVQFTDDSPKTHVHRGDPWDGNPVLERIQELQATDAKETALWEAKRQHPSGPKEPSSKGE